MPAEPLWLPVISHLFPNLCVQEPAWSRAMWQRSEGAAGPLSQHRVRPGYTATHRANAHTLTHSCTQKQARVQQAAAAPALLQAGAILPARTHMNWRCAGAIKQVLRGKRVQQRAHKSGTDTSGKKKKKKRTEQRQKTKKSHRRRACKRLFTQHMTGNRRKDASLWKSGRRDTAYSKSNVSSLPARLHYYYTASKYVIAYIWR